MPIRVDAYTNSGMASGWLLDAVRLRDSLERGDALELNRVTWQSLDDMVPTTPGSMAFDPDDLVVVVGDDDHIVPVHAVWHAVHLQAGPYRVEGELPTMPGFDPGRALTRPTGEFVLLRDVRMELLERPELGVVAAGHALVNRYAVERVDADMMLAFFFPGAEVDASRQPGPPVTLAPGEPAVDPAPSATPATPG